MKQVERDLLTIVKYPVTSQALGKAIQRVIDKNAPMTNDLLSAIEALSGTSPAPVHDQPPPQRTVERDDPYASRRAAMPLIQRLVSKGIVFQEVYDSIEHVTLKVDEVEAYANEMGWVERALRTQKKMEELERRKEPSQPPIEDPADDPDAPSVTESDLDSIKKPPKTKREKGG